MATEKNTASGLEAKTPEELILLVQTKEKELAEKDGLLKEQADLITKLEAKLGKVESKPVIDLGKKGFYTINSGANWAGKDYSAKELAEDATICAEILKEAPNTPIFTKEV
jgi:hypothetical protein